MTEREVYDAFYVFCEKMDRHCACKRICADMLSRADDLLNAHPEVTFHVFEQVALFFESGRCEEEVWEWLLSKAATANEDTRIQLTVLVFSHIPEEPWNPSALRRLFACLSEPRLRWLVFAAFENFPERLELDLAEVNEERSQSGLPKYLITPQELKEWRLSLGRDS